MKTIDYEAFLDSDTNGSSKDEDLLRALGRLTKNIVSYLVGEGLWLNTSIYVNGACFTPIKPTENLNNNLISETEESEGNTGTVYCYDDDVGQYTNYSNGILTMIFEGPLYQVFNHYMDSEYCNRFIKGFNQIIESFGLYYEMGNAWSLSLYEIEAGSFFVGVVDRIKMTAYLFP